MKSECTATVLKQKCSCHSGWKNHCHDQKKHVRVSCEGDVDSFLIGRASFIMSLFHVVRQSVKSFTRRS
jgi:hypothetical protein